MTSLNTIDEATLTHYMRRGRVLQGQAVRAAFGSLMQSIERLIMSGIRPAGRGPAAHRGA